MQSCKKEITGSSTSSSRSLVKSKSYRKNDNRVNDSSSAHQGNKRYTHKQYYYSVKESTLLAKFLIEYNMANAKST